MEMDVCVCVCVCIGGRSQSEDCMRTHTDYILVKGAYYPYLAEREVAEWARGMK